MPQTKKEMVGFVCNKLTVLDEFRRVKVKGENTLRLEWKCKCECGNSVWKRGGILRKLIYKDCGHSKENKKEDTNQLAERLIDAVYGNLKIIEVLGYGKRVKCICLLCNKNTMVKKLDTLDQNSMCQECRWNINGNNKFIVPHSFMQMFLRNAKERNLDVTVDRTFLSKLFASQNGRCALSGQEIVFRYGKGRVRYTETTASIDRIDSNKPYSEDNVQWVHKHINVMKHRCSDEQFFNHCKQIYFHLKDRYESENIRQINTKEQQAA